VQLVLLSQQSEQHRYRYLGHQLGRGLGFRERLAHAVHTAQAAFVIREGCSCAGVLLTLLTLAAGLIIRC
jgi:hypothetical protein